MSIKICLDAGHGGTDPGAVNGSLHEADAALAIAKKVGALLEARGASVKYTRTADKAVSLAERCKISDAFGADVFISIHLNSAENKNAAGIACGVQHLKCLIPKKNRCFFAAYPSSARHCRVVSASRMIWAFRASRESKRTSSRMCFKNSTRTVWP